MGLSAERKDNEDPIIGWRMRKDKDLTGKTSDIQILAVVGEALLTEIAQSFRRGAF